MASKIVKTTTPRSGLFAALRLLINLILNTKTNLCRHTIMQTQDRWEIRISQKFQRKWLLLVDLDSIFLSLAMIGSWFSEDLLTSSLFLLSQLIFICSYFTKEIPNGFPCLDTLIETLGMLLDFRKVKNTRLRGSCFFTLLSSLTASRVFGS